MSKPFLQLNELVTVDLGDGKELPLRYNLVTLKRIGAAIGKPVMGKKSVLLDVTEEALPEIIYYGLCDPEKLLDGDEAGAQATNAAGEPITIKTIMLLPSSSIGYLTVQFVKAYTQQAPPEKKAPELTLIDPTTTQA